METKLQNLYLLLQNGADYDTFAVCESWFPYFWMYQYDAKSNGKDHISGIQCQTQPKKRYYAAGLKIQ